MNSRIHLPASALITAVLLWQFPKAHAQTADENPANTDIEQLAVGNYWTTKETKFTADGEVDTERFSTAAVVGKERLGGRTCFRMKRIVHDDPRFDLALAGTENASDFIYYEYLDNGNLHYFEPATDPDDSSGPALDKNPATNAKITPSGTAPAKIAFTADNPALYLKFPAESGDLFETFDTVGSVIATDTVVTTPAGEFVCYVYGFVTDTSEAPHRSYTREYWCPGIGFVKLEEFEVTSDKKRLIYSMELLAYHLEDGRSGGNTDDNGRRGKIENVH